MSKLQNVACFGVSHKTAPVSVREHVHNLINHFVTELPAFVTEHAVLATCNRVELYVNVRTAEQLAQIPQQIGRGENLAPHCYLHVGDTAAEHLCRVSAGLDSLVLGEPQILGQVRHTAAHAQQKKTGGRALQSLLDHATTAGKRARTETAISHSPASVSSVAITLAQQTVGKLADKKIAIIGLGEMGRLVLKALRNRKHTKIILVNRTQATAEQLAHPADSTVIAWENLDQALAEADVLFTTTSAVDPIITTSNIEAIQAERNGRQLLLIDLSVPRNVATAVRDLPSTTLFDMDDLHSTLDEALASRQKEIPKVEQIITEELGELHTDLQKLKVQPLISELRQQAEEIRQKELARTMRHLGDDLDPAMQKHIEHLSRSLINKMLHQPMAHLRQQAQADEQVDLTAVRDLFGLENR